MDDRMIWMVVSWLIGACLWALLSTLYRRRSRKARIVDEYTLRLETKGEFNVVLLSFKLDNGRTEGPFEFVPGFGHQLSDELCVASARATTKSTGERSTGDFTISDVKLSGGAKSGL